MKKIFRKLSLKGEKVVNQTTGKKTLKKVVGLLGLVAFVTLCVINFKIGFADYNQKSRASLLTLEALSNGEGGGGESSTGKCYTSMVGTTIITWWCSCPESDYDDEIPKQITQTSYVCTGNEGGECKPGTILTYYDCSGSITNENDLRSVAYCGCQ